MKILSISALALSLGFVTASHASFVELFDFQPTGYNLARDSERYDFDCSGTAKYLKGEQELYHQVEVSGSIDNNRRTLDGKEVTVMLNGRLFSKFHLPQHSFWVKNGKLLSLYLRGDTSSSGNLESFLMRFSGRDSSQNGVSLTKIMGSGSKRTLATKDLNCFIKPSQW